MLHAFLPSASNLGVQTDQATQVGTADTTGSYQVYQRAQYLTSKKHFVQGTVDVFKCEICYNLNLRLIKDYKDIVYFLFEGF